MVSDIVLLKELPDFIRNSIEAYVGCIAGASLKGEYIETIGAAGFRDVTVIDETSFSVDYMVNSATAQAVIRDLAISPEVIRAAANSVVSMKVSAVKPY